MTRLAEYAEARELTLNLMLRELRGRYKRSALGWTWSLLNPLSTVLVFSVVFAFFLNIDPPVGDPSGLHNFAMFLLCGLLPFNYLSNGMNGALDSLLVEQQPDPEGLLPSRSARDLHDRRVARDVLRGARRPLRHPAAVRQHGPAVDTDAPRARGDPDGLRARHRSDAERAQRLLPRREALHRHLAPSALLFGADRVPDHVRRGCRDVARRSRSCGCTR